MTEKIIRNRVRCKGCDTILESKHCHDFVACACGTFVDGGREYLRGGWPGGNYDDWVEELHEFEEIPDPEVGLYGILVDKSKEEK